MRNLIIIGAGGHGKVIAETAALCGVWKEINFLDDRYPNIRRVLNWEVIGKCSRILECFGEYSHAFVAIGLNSDRMNVFREIKKIGYKIPNIIHPFSYVSESVNFGEGNVVIANTVINSGTVVGDACIINTGATVDHDCILRSGVHVSPGAHLGGEVSVGNNSWIGIGSSIIQGISIGKNAIVGAGAVVIRDIPDNVIAVGIPAHFTPNLKSYPC